MDSHLEMVIIQSKTSTRFGEDAIMKWKTISSNLLDLNNAIDNYSSRYNSDVRDAFQLFRDIYTSCIRKRIKLSFKYIYVTEGIEIHPNVQQQGEELKTIVLSYFPAARVDLEYVNADNLLTIINTPTVQDYQLTLADNPISLGKNKDYVALVSLPEFFHFITNHSSTLNQSIFEANIRDYQGSVVVNNEIYDSLCNNHSDDFWWLNNGITILANNIVPVTNKSLVITDPEIVNGLQTSNELFNYFSNNPNALSTDSRHILVRIIVPTSESSRDDIIRATNNQTTIPKSSLRASDAIHWQIEMFFKQKGLYYDRRKNHYKNLGKKSAEIISVSYLAQCLIAVLLSKPNYSRARPSTLLTNDDYYNPLYKNG
ncbi:MAG: AIPR family protein, partial [Lachnospiraceae bacterium]|nr:AIPR family protein [Lachnospiraceae bacterium]